MADLFGQEMDKFKENWNDYELKIESNRGPLILKWKDVDELAKYSTLQSGIFGTNKSFSKQTFFENFQKFYQHLWDLTQQLEGFNISDTSTIIDIGSGIGIIDLLLAQYLVNPKIYLIDKEEMNNKPKIYYSEEYFFYNSWKPTIDCINSTPNIKNKIFFLNPTDQWPKDVDCITSYFSWCMHYPKETYWKKIKDSLKVNGKLIVDVRKLTDRNVVEEISDEFKSTPEMYQFKNTVVNWIDNYQDNILGYRCVWTRKDNV